MRRPGLSVAALAVALAALAVAPGCRRKTGERPAAPAAPAAPGAPAAAATAGPVEPPAIRAAAVPGRPPFEGLSEPRDAAVDGAGRIWIADFGHSRLRLFDRDGGSLGGWGGKGSGTFGFHDLSGLAVRNEEIYVADTWNGRVQRFTTGGEWKGGASGMFGPRGVAAGGDSRVWVTDTGNHQVRVYDAALQKFESIGKQGSGPSEFSSPVGICVGRSGNAYVADTGNRRIVVLDSAGRFRTAWPIAGWERAVEPHLEVDDDESVFATDPGAAEQVIQFDRNGRIVQTWATGSRGEKFSLPSGLALDRATRTLYVINQGNGSVSRIALGRKS